MVQITFISAANERRTVDVKAGGSVMEAAVQNDIPGINADCGGSCSCATCHVYLDDLWLERTGPRTALEQEMLEMALDAGQNSRLACQIRVTEHIDGLTVTTPERQRNG